MKKVILFFGLAFFALVVKAQSGFNYKEFAVGVDAFNERGFTNIQRQDNHFGGSLNFTYNYSPYVPITAEIQFGQLSGGGLTVDKDPYGKEYTNNYKALYLHADFQLGEAIDYANNDFLNAVKGFYVGTGLGAVVNHNTVQRTNVIPANGRLDYVFPGKDNSINLSIPLRFGYEFKIYNGYDEPAIALDIGYVHNLVFGEGLDGYDDPPSKFKNNATNQYRQIVIGVKFSFGNITAYNKLIREYQY